MYEYVTVYGMWFWCFYAYIILLTTVCYSVYSSVCIIHIYHTRTVHTVYTNTVTQWGWGPPLTQIQYLVYYDTLSSLDEGNGPFI